MTNAVEPIAVIGLACRLPGALDIEEFWRNLVTGIESISVLDPADLVAAGVSEKDMANPDYVAAAPLMPLADEFDADLFAMRPNEALLCDPQIRVFLELCHAGVENAGYDPFALPDSVGVYGTTGDNGYLRQSMRRRPDLVEENLLVYTLNLPDYLSTLVSHRLDLHGPSLTVLSACSSSLVAVHLAAQALRTGDCDMALAGGSVLSMPVGHGYVWTPGSIHSADGHCRPFDAAASGTVFGSGAGLVVLKRLDDAIAAGDDVKAVILGSAVNNDGGAKVSFSAPSVSGQAAVVAEAMALAGTRPAAIDYVEAHATSTELGDPIEVHGLAEAYRTLSDQRAEPGRTAIGSVKSNIGHMNSAAGIAGLIKTVLMLERETMAPTINVETPNPRLELDQTPFQLVTALRPWPRNPDVPRTAGVSSLGVGGTNVHVVVGEGPGRPDRVVDDRARILPWSARGDDAVREYRESLVTYFRERPAELFADAVATLQHGRTPHPVRSAVVCGPGDVVAALTDSARVVSGRVRPDGTTVFVFPGQGAHLPRMAAGLYGTVRPFSIAMDECLELFEREGIHLYDRWLGAEPLWETEVVQPLLFAVEYSLAAMWTEWGVVADAVLGHSVGELTAAAVAGVFDLADAVRLVAARATAMAANPVPGGMLAVRADDLPELVSDVVVAARNGSRQTILSGPSAALDELAEKLSSSGIGSRRLDVPLAFHHPHWSTAAQEFRRTVDTVAAREPRIPLYSGLTGERVSAARVAEPSFWSDQLTNPVLFGSALGAVLEQPGRLVLEVGPGRTLTGLVRHHPAADAVPTVATLAAGHGAEAVLDAAARLWVAGVPVDWTALGQHPPVRRVSVPGYPYQRERYWIDSLPGDHHPVEPVRESATETGPFATVEWVRGDRPADAPAPPAGRTALVMLPPSAERALDAVLAVEGAGYRTVRIRPGDTYAEGDGEFQVRPGQPDDVTAVCARLAERGVVPDAVVHAMTFDRAVPEKDLGERLDAAFTSLLALARHAVRAGLSRLLVLTSASVDVSGSDVLDPARATVHGLVRSLRFEEPGLRCGVIDVGDRVGVADLTAELRVDNPPYAVALRGGGRRWLPAEVPLSVPAAGRDLLRHRGVYLVTGGFGGLGTAVARHLASRGLRPRLVLLGRRDPFDTAVGDEWGARVRAQVSDMRALGAEVTTIACDVTDGSALRAALARVRDEVGRIDGVFHLAGVPGDRMIAFRDSADAAAVLAPKTRGTENLLAALEEPPDFTVLFSSRAAASGLMGGADYAAGNSFLDAVAQAAPADGGRVLSIGWPVWLGAGMVDHGGPDLVRLAEVVAGLGTGSPPAVTWEGELGAASHWALDEHRSGRIPVFPGSAFVDLVITIFTDEFGVDGGPVELRDVVFHTAFADERARMVRVAFTAAETGYEFRVSSQVDGSSVVHVTGRVANACDAAAPVDISAVRDRLTATSNGIVPPLDVPFTLGPRWWGARREWRAGTERLALLELMPALVSDLSEHRLHPALLDLGTEAVLRDPGEGELAVCGIRRLVRYGDIPATLYSHARRDQSGAAGVSGDVDLVTPAGEVVVAVEGFTMGAPGVTSEAGTRQAPRAEDSGFGLDPEVGVGLLMRLLGNDVPAAVLVRPHRNGKPEPLDTAPVVARAAEPVTAPRPAEAAAAEGLPVVERLRELWTAALGSPPEGDRQDFFQAGGDSLAAVELVARIRAELGVRLTVGLLLDAGSFGGLAEIVERGTP
ncbi:SDR family NAD(P)-dependent oxidoreductase [Actinophytocola sp.]|uniref:type I polyketide synthase n=1 Tax=Actinophytocola sp. TaxID=1872138 RepID=UPI00389B11E8